MKWTVAIENKPNLRIKVGFLPFAESIEFIGQHKIKTGEWIDFCHEMESMDITVEKIQEVLLKTHDELQKRVDGYENIAEGFKFIKVIEIKEFDDDGLEIVKPSEDIFGDETPNESIYPPTSHQY